MRAGALKGLADVEETTFDWVNWYNNDRLHSFLGNLTEVGELDNAGGGDVRARLSGEPAWLRISWM